MKNIIGKGQRLFEATWERNGMKCAVVLQLMGHRCGYVWVDGTWLQGKDYNAEPVMGLDVHGGITFADYLEDWESNVGWALGFDCAHAGDAPDEKAAREAFGSACDGYKSYFDIYRHKLDLFDMPLMVWGTEDAVRETNRLCDQIKEAVTLDT